MLSKPQLKPLKIGKYTIPFPIIQGGMGVGISWDNLAGNVSKYGALGVISCVGSGYYKKVPLCKKSSSIALLIPLIFTPKNLYLKFLKMREKFVATIHLAQIFYMLLTNMGAWCAMLVKQAQI